MMDWLGIPNSDKCIGSPTKLKRKKDQHDLLIQLKQKQETVALQKLNKHSNIQSRKQRSKQNTLGNLSPSPPMYQEEENNFVDIDGLDDRNELEYTSTLANISPSKSIKKRYSEANTGLKNLAKSTNIQEQEIAKQNITIKSMAFTNRMSNDISSASRQKSKSIPTFQIQHNPAKVSDNLSTDRSQKLPLGEQDDDLDNINNFDDEYFNSNRRQDSALKPKIIDSAEEDHDDYFKSKQILVRDKNKPKPKIIKQSNQRNSHLAKEVDEQEDQKQQQKQNYIQRKSYQSAHDNSEQQKIGNKKRMLILFPTSSTSSSNQDNPYTVQSTRETSLRDTPNSENSFNISQNSNNKQFIIRSNKSSSVVLKTSKSVPIQQGSPSSSSSQIDSHLERGSFSNKSSRKTSDRIDYFSDLYQIIENQHDANEKSSENLSTGQSENEKKNNKIVSKRVSKIQSQQSTLNQIPMIKGVQNNSTGQYLTSQSSRSDSLYSKSSMNTIFMNSNNDSEKGGREESSKRNSISEQQNDTPSRRSTLIKDQLRLKKKHTLEYLDDDFYKKSVKQSILQFINEKNADECIDGNEDDYQNNEIYSPQEKLALRNSRNSENKSSSSSRKSTLTQQFLGNVKISQCQSQSSIISIQKRHRTLLISQQSGTFNRRSVEKRESIFSLLNYETILVDKMYELIESNGKLKKTIESVCNVDILTFGQQCEQVIASAIHDNIHGKVQKIVADSTLKERISDFFNVTLKQSCFDEQTQHIFSNQFGLKWHVFFTNTNLLEDMGGVDQIRLIVQKCLQQLKNKLSFQLNTVACSRACIRFFASLLTDNQSAISYYMTKLSETVLVTQMDFFLIKKSLYKALFQLSILDAGDLNFIMEKLEKCRAYLFPEDFLRSHDLIRMITETISKSKLFQQNEYQYFISKDFSVILLIIEIIIKLINYEVNIDDCITVLTPLCQKPLDEVFFCELTKVLRHFLVPLESSIMMHVNHLMNRLKMKLAQQNYTFPFNSCLLEIDQNELFSDVEDWLEDYFQYDDLNNLSDIFDFKYMKFIISFAMDQREIFQIQDSICAKNIYKPTPEAITYQKKALRCVIQNRLDQTYNKFISRRSTKLFSTLSNSNMQFGKSSSSIQSLDFKKQPQYLQTYLNNKTYETDKEVNEEDESETKRKLQYKQIEILFTYLNQCIDI